MRITFKSISGKQFSLDADSSSSVLDLKNEIAVANGYKVSSIRLLFNSKDLDDSLLISSIGYTEDKFLVIYIKKLPQRKNKIQNPQPKTETHNETQEEKPLELKSPIIDHTHPENNIMHSSPIKLFQKHSERDPPDFEEKVKLLENMGYSEGQCIEALRSALYQVEVAADYLLNGYIPDLPKPLNLDESQILENSDNDDEDERNGNAYTDLIYLKKLFHDHPENFVDYVHQLEQNGHEIAHVIKQDPVAFLYRIGLDPSKYDVNAFKKPASKYEELMTQFNNEEKNAIHRMESIGFDTMTIIQVYLACDKNEELTNSCLISMK